jgi:hypothetical protein
MPATTLSFSLCMTGEAVMLKYARERKPRAIFHDSFAPKCVSPGKEGGWIRFFCAIFLQGDHFFSGATEEVRERV